MLPSVSSYAVFAEFSFDAPKNALICGCLDFGIIIGARRAAENASAAESILKIILNELDLTKNSYGAWGESTVSSSSSHEEVYAAIF